MADRRMGKIKIKTVLKYIVALSIPPALCTLMIPLFAALLCAPNLLEIYPEKYLLFILNAIDAIAVGLSGFIMSLLISYLAKNREIMMTLFGVLIVVVRYAVVFADLFSSMNSYKLEVSWRSMLPCGTVNVIVLLGCALIGAWAIRRKRRLRAHEQ